MKSIKLVLFDKDGVLIDSMKNDMLAYNVMLVKFGKKSLSKKEYMKSCWGPSEEDCLKNAFGIIFMRKRKELLDYYHKKRIDLIKYTKVYPNVKRVLKKLKSEGYGTGVITSTETKTAEKILRGIGLAKYFDIIIGGDIAKPKPAPDPILKACKIFGVKPSETAYIGDNIEDVMAGKAAGCLTIAITNSHPRNYLKKADVVIKDVKEVLDLV
jgi:HAD superfamily hydrolase (TIGR01509 family)